MILSTSIMKQLLQFPTPCNKLVLQGTGERNFTGEEVNLPRFSLVTIADLKGPMPQVHCYQFSLYIHTCFQLFSVKHFAEIQKNKIIMQKSFFLANCLSSKGCFHQKLAEKFTLADDPNKSVFQSSFIIIIIIIINNQQDNVSYNMDEIKSITF